MVNEIKTSEGRTSRLRNNLNKGIKDEAKGEYRLINEKINRKKIYETVNDKIIIDRKINMFTTHSPFLSHFSAIPLISLFQPSPFPIPHSSHSFPFPPIPHTYKQLMGRGYVGGE